MAHRLVTCIPWIAALPGDKLCGKRIAAPSRFPAELNGIAVIAAPSRFPTELNGIAVIRKEEPAPCITCGTPKDGNNLSATYATSI